MLDHLLRQRKATAWLLVAMACAVPPTLAAEEEPETELRAAFVYHLTKFTSWPEHRFPDPGSPIRLCTLERGPALAALRATTRGRNVDGPEHLNR